MTTALSRWHIRPGTISTSTGNVSVSCDQQQSKMATRVDVSEKLILFSIFACALSIVQASDALRWADSARNKRSVVEFDFNAAYESISSAVSQMVNKEENIHNIAKRDVSCSDNNVITGDEINKKVSDIERVYVE